MEIDLIRENTIRTRRLRLKALTAGPAIWTGALVMTLYLALLPLADRTWRATGDEPHYLLAAHSLVTDRDFDLANNYDQLDYLAFYVSRDITRQVRADSDGRQILNHQLALPVLIAPAYAAAGRTGVLFFQVFLGGILAAISFKLAALVSGETWTAFIATLFVAFSPPLLTYVYLIYPELIGALLTTGIIYIVVRDDRPGLGGLIAVGLALALLPWLNRRFVPLAAALAVAAAWRWGRLVNWKAGRRAVTGGNDGRRFSRPFLRLYPVSWPVLAAALSIVLLWWFNSRLGAPARMDIASPADLSTLWERLGRGVGWLVDQQRGLFIFGPVYMLVAWGLPALAAGGNWRRAGWIVLLPVLMALAVTAAAGGFWVAWELGPRFLVVGLPALASLLALAWRTYRRSWLWRGLALFLFAAGIANSLIILQNPELPYKSSLPLFYGEKLGLPLAGLLPSLAGYARLDAAGQAEATLDRSRPALHAPAGSKATLIDSGPLNELPFGYYRLIWPVRTQANLPPDTALLRLSVKALGGGQIFNAVVTAADLPADGSYGLLDFAFRNPNVDRWRTPPVLHAVSTGRADIWAGDLAIDPDPFYAWFLAYLFLAVIALAAGVSWLRVGRDVPPPGLTNNGEAASAGQTLATPWLWGALLALLLAAAGVSIYQVRPAGRTYDARQFDHFTGRAATDPAAVDGQVWLVDPAVDPPQKAIHGPFDIYPTGLYRVAFRIKMPERPDTGRPLARLKVTATTNADELVTQPLRPDHFSGPDRYHEFVLTARNPRRQALSFEVDYLGLAPLMIDQVTVSAVDDSR